MKLAIRALIAAKQDKDQMLEKCSNQRMKLNYSKANLREV